MAGPQSLLSVTRLPSARFTESAIPVSASGLITGAAIISRQALRSTISGPEHYQLLLGRFRASSHVTLQVQHQ